MSSEVNERARRMYEDATPLPRTAWQSLGRDEMTLWLTRAEAEPRTTNFGPWAEWIENIPEADRAKIFALAERILPGLVHQAHSRFSGDFDDGQDDAAISSALRIAQRFYARIGMFGSKEKF